MSSPLGRKEVAAQRAADQAMGLPQSIQTTFCQICDVGVGPYCSQEEIWILPSRVRRKIICKIICGSCADELNLDFKYRIISTDAMRTLRRFQVGPIIHEAIRRLVAEASKENHGRR